MTRQSDACGWLGLILLLVGISLYLTGSVERMSWLYWLGGPVLWFAGFTMVVVWVVTRWFSPGERDHPMARQVKPK